MGGNPVNPGVAGWEIQESGTPEAHRDDADAEPLTFKGGPLGDFLVPIRAFPPFPRPDLGATLRPCAGSKALSALGGVPAAPSRDSHP